MIYSIIPIEEIMREDEQQWIRPTEEIQMGGILMEVQPLMARQARIVRIFSPNPFDYLNPRMTPGQIIRYEPENML